MKLSSILFASLTAIASVTAAAISKTSSAATAPSEVAEIPEYSMMYGYNPPRVNPDYCKGFHIDYPAHKGLVFEAGSHQYMKWSVDKDIKGTPEGPDAIFRIRILNATQHNEVVIAENVTLYNQENHGSVFYPLDIKDVEGDYHIRVMVHYGGQDVNCVYESVPFKVVHDTEKKYESDDRTPYFDENPTYTYSTAVIEDLYHSKDKMT